MNEKIKALTGVGLVGLLAAFAMYGKPLADALMGFIPFVRALSSTLPLGTWSALLALLVAMGAWAYALHWLPKTSSKEPPHLAAESVALAVGIAVTLSQQLAADRTSPGSILLAIWMGVAAGFGAPFLGKVIAKALKA